MPAADRSRQLFAFVARIRRALNRLSSPAIFVLSFLALIATGTAGLLVLPGLYAGARLGALDALFTMTSAVCVTGLIVVDTATYFSIWGQLWILLFLQLGGLGLITLTSVIIGSLGRRLSFRTEMIAVVAPNGHRDVEIWQLALSVTRFTLAVEAAGALLLFILWLPDLPMAAALWHAVFHAVSAFCNAGFSTFSDSLMSWRTSPGTLLVVAALIVVGGIGFVTVSEIGAWWKVNRGQRGVRSGHRRLSSHSVAVLVATAVLLVAGAVFFAIFEWNETLAGIGTGHRLVNALFMSVTARTAGFNSVDYAGLGNDGAFATIMLMFVGGAPGSTAGGIKVTTLAVLASLAWSRLRGRRVVQLHSRGVPEDTIERAVSLSLLAVAVLTVALLLLNAIHQEGVDYAAARPDFLPILFEAVSAFATVGLSMGMTDRMGDAGKVVLIFLMFVGRVGLFSFFAAVTLKRGRSRPLVHPAREDLLIG
jgi:trk system potassium uptake protein